MDRRTNQVFVIQKDYDGKSVMMTAKEFKMLKLVVANIRKCNKNLKDIFDKQKTGRICSAGSKKNIKIIRESIWINPRRWMRKIGRDLKIYEISFRNVVKKDLGLKTIKFQVTPVLTNTMK